MRPPAAARPHAGERSKAATAFAAIVVLIALLTACGGSADDPTTEAPTPTSSPTNPTTSPNAATVADVLRFSATGLDGTAVSGEVFAGKPVAFWFWAPH